MAYMHEKEKEKGMQRRFYCGGGSRASLNTYFLPLTAL